MTFGQKIKKLRREADYTQARLGELLSVSTQAISRWETDAAMPDISLLAPLANLFNVTTDYLLDVDIQKKNERIDAIIREANVEMCRNQKDRWNNAVKVFRGGLRLYPDSWELKSKLAFFLQFCQGNEDEKERNYREANEICEDIVANCPEQRLQYEAIHEITRLAGHLDNRPRALELAQTMPLVHQCREFLMMGNLKKEEAIPHGKKLIHTLYVHMCGLLFGYAKTLDSSKEVVALYEKAAAIQDVLYEDDDFVKSGILGDSQVEWAGELARVGAIDKAYQLLDEDLDRLIDIRGRKLSRFSMLSPEAYTKQVEAADISVRDDDQRFRAEDDLNYMDKYFSEAFKKDERYPKIIERYQQYICEVKTGRH